MCHVKSYHDNIVLVQCLFFVLSSLLFSGGFPSVYKSVSIKLIILYYVVVGGRQYLCESQKDVQHHQAAVSILGLVRA